MPSRRRFPFASLAASALTLAACSGAGGDAAPAGGLRLPLVAHGNAPFWWLRIDTASVSFGTLEDEPMFDAELDRPVLHGADGAFVCRAESDGRRLDATLLPGLGVDAASGMPYPFSVTVRVDGREWRGVGGDPGDLLRGFPWVVTQVGDRQLPATLRPTLEFRNGDVLVFAAEAGCTLGLWRIGGESLSLSGFDTLPSPLREAMAGVDAFSISAGGELVLEGEDGVLLRAVRQKS